MATAEISVLALGRPDASAVLKLDERRDREQTLGDKVDSVRRRLES